MTRAALPFVALLASACSTIADEPLPECVEDTDCGEDLICSFAQGSICVPEVQPPLANLGFDIREGDFRIELKGCDPEVGLEPGGNGLRIRSRDRLAREFELSVSSIREVDNCGECEPGFTCDADALTCKGPVEAQLDLTQNSRLGLQALVSPVEDYTIPIDPPLPEGELPPPTSMVWPQYDAEDLAAHWATQLDIAPLGADVSRGTMRRVLADTVEGTFELASTQRCHRGLFGNEGAVKLFQGGAVLDANVEFFYDEPIAAPSTVIGPIPTLCSDDMPCPPGWACSSSGACALDLSGLSAGATTSLAQPAGGFGPAWLYTYCEGIPSPVDDPLLIDLYVRVTPLVETGSGLPQVVYRVTQPFPDPQTLASPRLHPFIGTLCLPPWQPPHTIGFSVVGAPVELATTEQGTYRCCSTDCLPTQAAGVEPIPPPNVDSCSGFERVLFTTQWFLEDVQDWVLGDPAGCTPPTTNTDGGNGRYVREVVDCGEGPCSVNLTHGEEGELQRLYEVAIVQPVGSVFRSRQLQVTIDADTVDFGGPFELEPRVLLHGRIVCAGDGDTNCNSVNGFVAAERLRVDTDEASPLGPFFFQGRSDAEGNFVLPVEPGVYVLTGYPGVGQPGGPAPLQIVDLRSDSPLVQTDDGVPRATLAKPIELDEGLLVRALLKDFDVNTGVAPLDLGSWTSDPAFEGIDLNAPETCHNTSTRRGCVIRRLRPTDASISLLLSKRFQFTARTAGAKQCSP